MTITSRYVLFVNLSYVTIGDVRTNSHALLLQQGEDPTKPRGTAARSMLRGFMTDPALPTFDLVVPSFEHELVRIPPPWWIPRADDGEILLRGPGWREDIVLSAQVVSDLGIRMVAFPDDTPIDRVWETLVREVAASWAAPAMPVKYYQDAEGVRQRLGVDARLSRDLSIPGVRTPLIDD